MGVTFSKDSALKIKKFINHLENPTQDRTTTPGTNDPIDKQFWALVLGAADPGAKRFTFARVYPDASPDRVEFRIDNSGVAYRFADEVAQSGFCREANGNPAVPPLTVVLMHFIGYDADNLPAYLFQYVAPMPDVFVAPHDYRDNFNGGISFSCYHPGTSLPQQPWAY